MLKVPCSAWSGTLECTVTDFQVSFVNFPHDFLEQDNFVLDILRIVAAKNSEVKKALTKEVLYFSGCYTQDKLSKRFLNRLKAELNPQAMTRWLELQYGLDKVPISCTKSMWITFENRRPPFRDYQRSLTFDLDSFSGTNYYLPLWVTYFDFLETQSHWVRHKVRQKTLLEGREKAPLRRKFACAFINNPSPMRLRAIEELSKIGEIDVYGRYSNRYVNQKIEKSREYMFSICFENDLYPGYVTEKPLEAWLGDTIPLYWGYDEANYLNKSGMINLADFVSLSDFCENVAKVFESKELYEEIYSQPFLNRPFDIQSVFNFFESWILE